VQLGPGIEDERDLAPEEHRRDLCGALDVTAADLVPGLVAVLRLVENLADEQLAPDRRREVLLRGLLVPGERRAVGQDDGEVVLDGDPALLVGILGGQGGARTEQAAGQDQR
jgi:hypothetical protein